MDRGRGFTGDVAPVWPQKSALDEFAEVGGRTKRKAACNALRLSDACRVALEWCRGMVRKGCALALRRATGRADAA